MSVYRNYPPEGPTAPHAPFMRQALRNGPDATQPSRPHEATLDWLATAERVGRHVDLDASAHALGAMLRRRGVPSATNLLCLSFLYGPGRMPLRLIAERAASFDIAHVSEPALLRRLLNASPWLEHVASALIQEQLLRAARPQSPDPLNDVAAVAAVRLPIDPYSIMSEQDNLARQVETARRFVVDFVPWPEDMFTDAQVHWLLCVRWTFVASTIKDGTTSRADADAQSGPTLDRTRMMSHLIAACISREA